MTVPATTTKMGWCHGSFFLAELSQDVPLLIITAFSVLRRDSGTHPFCETGLKWKFFIDTSQTTQVITVQSGS